MLSLCERFHCTPSQLDKEGAEIVRLLSVVMRGRKAEE